MFGYIIVKNPVIPSPPAPPQPQPFCQPSRNFVRSTPFWFTIFALAGYRPAKFTACVTIFSTLNFSPRTKNENFLQKQPVVHFATPESSGYMVYWLQINPIICALHGLGAYSMPSHPPQNSLTIPIVCIFATLPCRPPSKRRTLWRRTFLRMGQLMSRSSVLFFSRAALFCSPSRVKRHAFCTPNTPNLAAQLFVHPGNRDRMRPIMVDR